MRKIPFLIKCISLMLALLLCGGGLSACGQEGGSIRIDLSADIDTLDPQLAVAQDAVTIILNCFEGLVRRTSGGDIAAAGASSWEISPDGRSYTFQLRDDALWSDGAAVTARDYLFAFERIFDYDYLSPYAAIFSDIAGADERIALARTISELSAAQAREAAAEKDDPAAQEQPSPDTEGGPETDKQTVSAVDTTPDTTPDTALDAEALPEQEQTAPPPTADELYAQMTAQIAALPELGVRAQDDNTLTFTLKRASSGFLGLLASCAAMPCREDFFSECRGRYAHTDEYFISNGSFTVSYWQDGDCVRLSPNSEYYDAESVVPPYVYFYTDGSDARAGLLAGNADYARLSYSDAASAEAAGLTVFSRENQIWALVFCQRGGLCAAQPVRSALMHTADISGYVGAGRIPERYGAAASLIASGAVIASQRFSEFGISAPQTVFDPLLARQELAQGLGELGLSQASALSFILPDNAELADIAGYLQRAWLDELKLYVNVYALPEAEYRQRLSSGDYDIAFQLLSSGGDGPDGTLSFFRSDSADNCCGYASAEYDELLSDAAAEADPALAAQGYAGAEHLLAADAAALPVFTQRSYYAFGKGVTGIETLPDGTMIFKSAHRKK